MVEGLDELAEFLGDGFADAVAVVAGGNLLHGVGEGFDGPGDLLGEVEGEPGGGEESEAGHHQQEQHVLPADGTTLTVEGPVAGGSVLQARGGFGDASGQRHADDDYTAFPGGGEAEGVVGRADGEDGSITAAGEAEDVGVDRVGGELLGPGFDGGG